MNINLSISPAPTLINKLAVCIYKASAPNTLVDSQEFNPPHTSPRNITFTDVEAVSWIVNTHETTGLPSLGTLRHSFIYDPSYTQAEIKPTEFLKMTAGQTGYTDEEWVGWEIESIERVGQGTQYPDQNIAMRPNGFDLLGDGDQFTDQEKWVVRFYPRISQSDVNVITSKVFNGAEQIVDDTVIDESFNGKIIVVQGSTSVIQLTLKPCAVLGPYQPVCIVSNGGSHVAVKVICEGNTDPFLFAGDSVNEIMLGQSEQLNLTTTPDFGFVVTAASHTILQAGQIVYAWDIDNEPNVRPAAGQLLNRNIYRRLWLAVQNMPANMLVSEAVWNDTSGGQNNKGKFSTGDGSTTFRLPQIYSAGFLRAVDGTTRLTGTYEADDNKAHAHGFKKPSLVTGTVFEAGKIDDGSEVPMRHFDSQTESSGSEARPKNYGVFALVRI